MAQSMACRITAALETKREKRAKANGAEHGLSHNCGIRNEKGKKSKSEMQNPERGSATSYPATAPSPGSHHPRSPCSWDSVCPSCPAGCDGRRCHSRSRGQSDRLKVHRA